MAGWGRSDIEMSQGEFTDGPLFCYMQEKAQPALLVVPHIQDWGFLTEKC